MPAATGFMTAVRKPRATSARVSATVTSVLPTPVSVPVMKKPCFAGVGRHVCAAPADRAGRDEASRAESPSGACARRSPPQQIAWITS